MAAWLLLMTIAGVPQPPSEHASWEHCQAAAMTIAEASLRRGWRVKYACEPKPDERRSP